MMSLDSLQSVFLDVEDVLPFVAARIVFRLVGALVCQVVAAFVGVAAVVVLATPDAF